MQPVPLPIAMWHSGRLSRRSLLQGSAISLGAIAGLSGLPFPARAEARGALVSLSRLGSRGLQLLVVDGRVGLLATVPVANPPPTWDPDPFDRFGSVVGADGQNGALSGNRNIHEPQLYFPWGTSEPAAEIAAFRGTAGPRPGDDPSSWSIEIDGAPVSVRGLWRKSVPIRTVRTGPRSYANEARHLVSFELDAEVPVGAAISATIEGNARFEGVLTTDSRSEAIHVCQAGYAVSGPKKAYAGLWLGHDRHGESGSTDGILSPEISWRLRDTATRQVHAEGVLAAAKPANSAHQRGLNFNGCTIYEADFSAVKREGEYQLEVPDLGASPAFPITSAPFEQAARLAARWYFHQRSGCEIAAPFGEGRVRPRDGHPADGLTVTQTDIRLGRTSEGFSPAASVFKELAAFEDRHRDFPSVLNDRAWGGWHDAADWDRRIQHCEAIYVMAQIVEDLPSARRMDLNLPESGQPFASPSVGARKGPQDLGDRSTVLPDLIHEALWGLSLWRRTQGEDGRVIGGVEYSSDGILGSVSWNPVQKIYAYDAEEWAAYQFAMAASKLGHVVRTVCGDAVLGQELVAEAAAAWDWAERTLLERAQGYEERELAQIAQARLIASGPLFRATGRPDIRDVFDRLNPFSNDVGPTPRGAMSFQAWDYVMAGREGHPADAEVARGIEAWSGTRRRGDARLGADYGLHTSALVPWGTGWMRFGPGSNWPARRAWLAALAQGEPPPDLRGLVLEGMWFALGCNPSNVCFVQGIGTRAFGDPLLVDPQDPGPTPGHVVFGVAAGLLKPYALQAIEDVLYPHNQEAWPIYARIFESHRAVECAEHGMKSNVLEWLFACFLARELV